MNPATGPAAPWPFVHPIRGLLVERLSAGGFGDVRDGRQHLAGLRVVLADGVLPDIDKAPACRRPCRDPAARRTTRSRCRPCRSESSPAHARSSRRSADPAPLRSRWLVRSFGRLSTQTLSSLSTARPVTPPIFHLFGSGLGQSGSYLKRGALCALDPAMTATEIRSATPASTASTAPSFGLISCSCRGAFRRTLNVRAHRGPLALCIADYDLQELARSCRLVREWVRAASTSSFSLIMFR